MSQPSPFEQYQRIVREQWVRRKISPSMEAEGEYMEQLDELWWQMRPDEHVLIEQWIEDEKPRDNSPPAVSSSLKWVESLDAKHSPRSAA